MIESKRGNRIVQQAPGQDLGRRMGEQSYEKVKYHTPEEWAKDFESIVLKLANKGST